MHATRTVLALVPAAALLAFAACGGRDTLDTNAFVAVDGEGRAVHASSGSDGGVGAGGASGVDAGDAASDAPVDAPQLLLCTVAPAGDPLALVSYSDSPAGAPRLVVLEPGSPGAASRVAIGSLKEEANTWHPEYRVTRATIGPAWPAGTALDAPLVVWGVDDHAWGELAHGPGDTVGLLAYYGGELVAPTGVRFRPFDATTWTPGEAVYVDQNGEAPYSLAAGASVGAMGIGYGGVGYGAAWRSAPTMVGQSHPLAAVLDVAGNVVIGPFAVAAPAQYPGRAADVAWTGTTYLVATSNGVCDAGDPLCAPRSTVIFRLRPATGDAVDDSAAIVTATIPVLDPATTPGRPIVAAVPGGMLFAWSEGDAQNNLSPRTVRVARVGTNGALVGAPVTIAENVVLATGLVVTAGKLGLLVGWGEPGDTTLSPKESGYSRLVLHHLDLAGAPVQKSIHLPITQLETFGKGTIVELASPDGYLLTWSGASKDAYVQTYLLRLDCLVK